MTKRLQTKIRSAVIEFLERTDQLGRVLEWRCRRNRRRRQRRERVVRRSLHTVVRGLESDRSQIVGAISEDRGWIEAVVARRRERHRVVDVMNSNREVVLAALKRAGIPYQQLPIDSPNRYRIGVPARSRSAILKALSEIDVTIHLYIDQPSIARTKQIVRIEQSTLQQIRKITRRADVWRVFEYLSLADGNDVFGHLHGCEIEFWTETDGDRLQSAQWNELVTETPRAIFGHATTTHPSVSKPTFPIDLVYTWVDGDDPEWQRRRRQAVGAEITNRHAEASSDARFASRDELLYSLRSVERYADFVRHIYIVTDQQRPDWLDVQAEGISVVDHSEIFQTDDALPTFNSHAIESRLHHIPGLSEHYIYLNDDFFFGRRVLPDLFFMANGLAKHFLSHSLIPLGAPSLDVKPVDAAAMNGRDLVEEHFRVSPTRKFKHAPYPQLRSVNLEIDALFPEEMAQTALSRFRHPTDLPVASSLHHHVGFVTGRSMPAEIAALYVDLGAADLQGRLDQLLKAHNFDTLCLNDSDLGFIDPNRKAQLVADFLEAYFPAKSRFEL